MHKNQTILLLLFVGILIFISLLAYTENIPTEIKMIPYYDSIGHFVLFGLLGLLAHYAVNRKCVTVYRVLIPVGPIFAVLYAMVDEFLQLLSDKRTFDVGDLSFGILGIFVFVSSVEYFRKRKV